MEPATAGALYAAENIVQGAVALVKGITHPTVPLKAKLTHISSVSLPRSQHTVSIVKGRAYVFGGESQPGVLADNAMHVVILPSSGVLEADYTTIPARATNGLDDVPSPRKGHTAVVIGDSIYVFGGEGDGVADEKGRLWVFHTISKAWTYLDPASDSGFPSQRAGHASASSGLPGPKAVTFQEKAPQRPADPAKHVPEPADLDSWGTIFVLGGRDNATRALANDAFAFDVRTRAWSRIPSPPGPSREGVSVTLVGDHLYCFGGQSESANTTETAHAIDVSHVWKHAEGGTTPLTAGWTWTKVSAAENAKKAILAPPARSSAGLVGVTTGQGRHYLIAVGGEGHDSMYLDDIWALQLPPERATAAATKDAIRASIKRDTHESEWSEVLYRYVDSKGDNELEAEHAPPRGLGARGQFGIAKGTEVDGATFVVWGGLDAEGNVLDDGWMGTVER